MEHGYNDDLNAGGTPDAGDGQADAGNDVDDDAGDEPAGDGKRLVKVCGELCTRRKQGRICHSEILRLALFVGQ